MLAAVPAFVQLHLRAIKHTVQSAQHLIVGVSETDPGVEDRRALRSFVCRCLMKASIANQAEFHPIKPPPIRLSFCGEGRSRLTRPGASMRARTVLSWLDGVYLSSLGNTVTRTDCISPRGSKNTVSRGDECLSR